MTTQTLANYRIVNTEGNLSQSQWVGDILRCKSTTDNFSSESCVGRLSVYRQGKVQVLSIRLNENMGSIQYKAFSPIGQTYSMYDIEDWVRNILRTNLDKVDSSLNI